MKKSIRFRLNGQPTALETEGNRTLLWVLRTDLGLTGTKYGCGAGVCGSCTVVVDGKAVRSCQSTLEEIQDAEVTTIEGLARDGALHPLQRAFVDHGGLQCGFCTPGMIMSAYGLLLADPRPSREKVMDAMEGNLCRCSAYKRILEAIESVARGEGRSGMSPDLDRRSFLKLVGGGIVVLVRLGPSPALAQGGGYPKDLNAYLRIDEDGKVTVFSGKIEMGQGVMTSQAQMAAEELGVSLDAIEMVLGDTDRCPWDMGTWGSLTTRMFGPVLRAAAAEARSALLELAAEKLGAPRESLVVESGVVSVKGEPGRQVSYGALTKGQAIVRSVDEEAVLRAVGEFTVMGRSPLRLDAEAKVTGAARYAADIRLPGLLYARILRPPAHGATLARVDTTEARAMAGIRVVEEDGLVAVLHADPEVAAAALGRLRPQWNAAPARGGHRRHLRRPREPGPGAGDEGGPRRRGGGAGRGRAGVRERLPQGLRGSRPDRAPRGHGHDGGREAHRVVVDAGALPHPRHAREGDGPRGEGRPGDHPLRGRRVRRERAPAARPRRPPDSRSAPAGPCRWRTRGPRSSSTTRWTRPAS